MTAEAMRALGLSAAETVKRRQEWGDVDRKLDLVATETAEVIQKLDEVGDIECTKDSLAPVLRQVLRRQAIGWGL